MNRLPKTFTQVGTVDEFGLQWSQHPFSARATLFLGWPIVVQNGNVRVHDRVNALFSFEVGSVAEALRKIRKIEAEHVYE